MEKIHNFSNLSKECQEIALLAVQKIDQSFNSFLSIAKYCNLYEYSHEEKDWMESEHQGPLFLYNSTISYTAIKESVSSLRFMVLNHKSIDNKLWEIARADIQGMVKTKEADKWVILNYLTPKGEVRNYWIWFSFDHDRKSFVSSIEKWWIQHDIKIQWFRKEEDENGGKAQDDSFFQQEEDDKINEDE